MKIRGRVLAALLLSFPVLTPSHAVFAAFRFGAGKADITGPAAETGMIGYGSPTQETRGIHSRLYSRAFVFENTEIQKRIAFVSVDLLFVTDALRSAAIDLLSRSLPGMYSNDNVMVSATHTHSDTGGYSNYILFSLTTLGSTEQSFDAIASGISESLQMAHARLEEASLALSEDWLPNVTVNRSLPAFQANLPTPYDSNPTFPRMTHLKAVSINGKDIGAINWFAVHGTSMSKHNHLVSSDNKGYAAYLFERSEATPEGSTFVAAFANSNEGDISPNIYDEEWNRKYEDEESVRIIGEAQFKKARSLHEMGVPLYDTLLDSRHRWVKMPGFKVSSEFTSSQEETLCDGALGMSFAAGAEDGRSDTPGLREGMRQSDIGLFETPLVFLYRAIGGAFFGVQSNDDLCHAPKPVLISTGRHSPPWTPQTLPFQIFRIGEIAIAAIPAEPTTMAGRILRKAILDRLRPIGVRTVIISGLANSYGSYLTTRQEYELQNYEGASTMFGPNTFAAHFKILTGLAEDMSLGRASPPGDPPPSTDTPIPELRPGVILDGKRANERFGSLLKEPHASYRRGEVVKAVFRTGHPKNDLMRGKAYFELQFRFPDGWKTVATEADPELTYRWKRSKSLDCLTCSSATALWKIPSDAASGIYRLLHRGTYRESLNSELRDFESASASFIVTI